MSNRSAKQTVTQRTALKAMLFVAAVGACLVAAGIASSTPPCWSHSANTALGCVTSTSSTTTSSGGTTTTAPTITTGPTTTATTRTTNTASTTTTGSTTGSGSLATMLPAALPQSTGAVFYVSTSGSDANPGTLAAPWATVQKALNTLLPGQTALVRAGTYSANLVMNRAGTATAPITVKNYPGERPVLQPAASAPTYAIRITKGAAWFRLHGFVIQNAPSGYDNVWISDGQDYTSRYPTHDIELSGNEIRNGLWTGLLVSPNVYNAEIIGNYVHNNGDWVSQHHGLYIQGQHCLVADNVVAHHYGFGIQVRGNYPDSDTATRIAATGNLITNNTVTDSQTYSGILVENNAQQTTIVNNITAYNGSYGVRGYYNGDGEWLSGNKAFGNLSYGNGSGNYGDTQGTIIDYSAGNLLANPLFVDRTGSNFHLQSGSPAIGVGLAAYAPLFDMDGNLRSPAPNVGAY